MKKLELRDKLDFCDIDLTPPNAVVEQIASQLELETEGVIQGVVKPYTGSVELDNHRGLAGIGAVLGLAAKSGDVQESLGAWGGENHRYDFALHTPVYDTYRYRICYLQYGIAHYPVKIVMDQMVAESVFGKRNANYVVYCADREELEDLMIKILYSPQVLSVMQELVRVYQIKRPQQIEALNEKADIQ